MSLRSTTQLLQFPEEVKNIECSLSHIEMVKYDFSGLAVIQFQIKFSVNPI